MTFDNEEVHSSGCEEQTASEDVPVAKVDVADDERGEESQEEVPKPVRGRGERHGVLHDRQVSTRPAKTFEKHSAMSLDSHGVENVPSDIWMGTTLQRWSTR